MIERTTLTQHPLPWSVSRRDAPVEIDRSDAFELWEFHDADGGLVATLVEPVTSTPVETLPEPVGKPAPYPSNHWCLVTKPPPGQPGVGCTCTTRADHNEDQMDRPELPRYTPPGPITGPPVVLALASTLHEEREAAAERRRTGLWVANDHPAVTVTVPGVGGRIFGAVPPGTVPSDHADVAPRREPNGRRDLAIIEAMLRDALRLVGQEIVRLDHDVTAPSSEVVALAGQHLATVLDNGELSALDAASRSALRTVLRAVEPS